MASVDVQQLPSSHISHPMDVDSSSDSKPATGIRGYYLSKIGELEAVINEKLQNKRRLEAQRNELNGKGRRLAQLSPPYLWCGVHVAAFHSSRVARRAAVSA